MVSTAVEHAQSLNAERGTPSLSVGTTKEGLLEDYRNSACVGKGERGGTFKREEKLEEKE